MRKRPMLMLAFVFWLGLYQRETANVGLAAAALLVTLYAGYPLWRNGKKGDCLACSTVLLLCFLVGMCRMSAYEDDVRGYLAGKRDGAETVICGTVIDKEPWGEKTQYRLDDGSGFYCLVRTEDGTCERGQALVFSGKIRFFSHSRNDGGYDEADYEKSRGNLFALDMAKKEQMVREASAWQNILNRIREKGKAILLRSLTESHGKTMCAILLGDKKNVEQEVKVRYKNSGILHILTISGLHISLLAMGLYRRLKRSRMGRIPAFIAVFFLVWNYAQLIGMGLSVRRALVMFVLGCAAPVCRRSYDSLSGLGLYLLITMWENPFVLRNTGYVYALTAVIGIACIVVPVQKCMAERGEAERGLSKKNRIVSKITARLVSSVLIWLVTLPAVAFYQFEIPLYAAAANFLILPFLKPLLLLGLCGTAAGMLVSASAGLFLGPADWILRFFDLVCEGLECLPESLLIVGRPAVYRLVIYIILIILLRIFCVSNIKSKYERTKSGYKTKKRSCVVKFRFYLLSIVVASIAFGILAFSGPAQAQMTMLDLGQGEGIFLSDGAGMDCFVDGGSTSVSKAGQYRILPFLKYHGVREIDFWFVSHADEDHVNGLAEVLQSGYPVRRLVLADDGRKDEARDALVRLARKAGTQIAALAPGETIASERMAFSGVLSSGENMDRNQNSLVMTVKLYQSLILLTGDITARQEEELMQRNWISDVDIYKAAHHGSKTANSESYLLAMRPHLALISCGEGNRYGHPSAEAVSNMKNAGAKIFCTKDSGQISLLVSKKGMELTESVRSSRDEIDR